MKQQHITLRPSFTFLFSYVWLAGELLLFNYIIQIYFTSISFPLTILFMLCFARLYYWLDFSSESGVQTFFILGIIPLTWIVSVLGFSGNFLLILAFYLSVFIAFGILRILTSRFILSHKIITHIITREKAYEIDHSRPLKLDQHSRGKLLNFGCILIPIKDSKKNKTSLISTLLFKQRNSNKFSGFLRIDGIADAQQIVQTVKQYFLDE